MRDLTANLTRSALAEPARAGGLPQNTDTSQSNAAVPDAAFGILIQKTSK